MIAADVHVARRALVGQERDVDRAQPIHVPLGHAPNPSRLCDRSPYGLTLAVLAARSARGCGGVGRTLRLPDAPAARAPTRSSSAGVSRPAAPGRDRAAARPGRRRAGETVEADRRATAGGRAFASPRPASMAQRRRDDPRQRAGTVVVGAHYDTKDVPGFVGANDGASGVAVVLELARAISPARRLDGPAVDLAFFDAEEARGDRPFDRDGTRGSRQFVRYARTAASGHRRRCARSGRWSSSTWSATATSQIPREANSDRGSTPAFADAAPERRSAAPSAAGAASSTTTRRSSTPASPPVDLIDFDYGPGPSPGRLVAHHARTTWTTSAPSLGAVGEPAWPRCPRFAESGGIPRAQYPLRAMASADPCARAEARAARRSARLLRGRRPRRAGGRAGARALRAAGLRPQGDRPQQARRRPARQARRDLRRPGDRGPRGRAGRLLRPRGGADGARERRARGGCGRSTPPARW